MKADDIVKFFGGMSGQAAKTIKKDKSRNQSALDKAKKAITPKKK